MKKIISVCLCLVFLPLYVSPVLAEKNPIEPSSTEEQNDINKDLMLYPKHEDKKPPYPEIKLFTEPTGKTEGDNKVILFLKKERYLLNNVNAPLNISLWDKCGLFNKSNIYGIDLGIFGTKARNVYGIQVSPIYTMAEENIYGFQISLANCQVKKLIGFQIGLINGNAMIVSPDEYLLKTNKLDKESIYGIQAALIENSANKVVGIQFAYVNVAKNVSGIQCGIANYCKNLKGIQIGLLNKAENSLIYSYTTGINVGW